MYVEFCGIICMYLKGGELFFRGNQNSERLYMLSRASLVSILYILIRENYDAKKNVQQVI